MIRNGSIVALVVAIALGFFAVGAQAQEFQQQDQYGQMISAINNVETEISELEGQTDLTAENIQVVNASDLVQGNDTQSLDEVVNRNQDAIDQLRQTLTSHQAVQEALPADVTTDDVVAVDVSDQGQVVVYYHQQQEQEQYQEEGQEGFPQNQEPQEPQNGTEY